MEMVKRINFRGRERDEEWMFKVLDKDCTNLPTASKLKSFKFSVYINEIQQSCVIKSLISLIINHLNQLATTKLIRIHQVCLDTEDLGCCAYCI